MTNLNCNGPGSLNEALNTPGAKYIVFTVSGIIDCAAEITWGNCTIAGQTSPGGITVRGILLDDYYEPAGLAQNVIIRHLNSRPNTEDVRPGTGWVMDDGLRLDGASNIVVDHCTFANAIDEAVQLSRSSNITIQNCMLAETLGGHYDLGGMLINYSTTAHPKDNVSIHHNVWNRIGGRMPEFACEESGETPGDMACLNNPFHVELSNNLLWDIPIQVWYTQGFNGSNSSAWHDVLGNFVNNHAVGRTDYCGPNFAFDLLAHAGNEFYANGNTMNGYPAYSDYELFYCCNDFCDPFNHPNTDPGAATQRSARFNYPSIAYTPSASLRSHILGNAGAFNGHSPMNRDSMNRRLLKFLQMNALDLNPVNGTDFYNDAFLLDFNTPPAAPADTDNDGMPNDWETAYGLNPNVQDHNGSDLSVLMTGVAGYSNLECYLNQLSDELVLGLMTPLPVEVVDFQAIPLAAEQKVLLRWSVASAADTDYFSIERSTDGRQFDKIGKLAANNSNQTVRYELVDNHAPMGQILYRLFAIGFDGSQEHIKTISLVLKNADEWLRIHRNISAQRLEIEVLDENRLPVEAAMVDVAGRIHRRFSIRNGQGEADVAGLPPGVYFLELSNGYLRQVEKVVVGW